ncbi:MAG: insulinase family protein [Clostridia bacterium]|nr:insulinase family protein [Clostridia bacterium]
MSKFTQTFYPVMGEKLLVAEHESGLKVLFVPRDAGEAFALFGVKYGALDNTFTVDGKQITVPDGIAHFLEHKLFDNEDGEDTFARFAALGAEANAFTSNEMTAYLFSATENIHENLETLLNYVTHPYFTPETVAKEQGIIGQEIRMYEDDPSTRLEFGLLECLYHNHPIKIDIAGTVESIAEITDKTLYDCYNTFYNLHNMVLVLCGPFEEDRILSVCDKVLQKAPPFLAKRTTPEEPNTVCKPRFEKNLPVMMPHFAVGMKETELGGGSDAFLRRVAAQNVALFCYFSRASKFFANLYEKGVLSEVFSTAYQYLDSCAYTVWRGESERAQEVAAAIRETIKLAKETELSDEDFELAKRAVYGEVVQSFNSPWDVCWQWLANHFLDLDPFRLAEVVPTLTKDEIYDRISHWDVRLICESYILPTKGE